MDKLPSRRIHIRLRDSVCPFCTIFLKPLKKVLQNKFVFQHLLFSLSCDKGRQRIRHTQEIPEYSKEYIFNTDNPVTAKVFVIDNTIYSTMLLDSEY